MKDRVLAIVKPDGLEKGLLLEICERIEGKGLIIVSMRRDKMSLELAKILYSHVETKYPTIWWPMLRYVTSSDCVFLVVEGKSLNEMIADLREIRGSSDPSKSDKGTIRGDYASEQDMTKLYAKGQATKNIMHTPDDPESARFELRLFCGKEE